MSFIKPGNVECWQTCQGHRRWQWGGVGSESISEESKESQRMSIPLGRQDMPAKDESGLAARKTGKRGRWSELPMLGYLALNLICPQGRGATRSCSPGPSFKDIQLSDWAMDWFWIEKPRKISTCIRCRWSGAARAGYLCF